MNNYEKHHANLPDLDLIRIAYFEFRIHKKEARISVKKIIKQRNLTDRKVKELRHQVRMLKKAERRERLQDENDEYAIVEFLGDILFEVIFRGIFVGFASLFE